PSTDGHRPWRRPVGLAQQRGLADATTAFARWCDRIGIRQNFGTGPTSPAQPHVVRVYRRALVDAARRGAALRAILFALIAMIVAWMQIALTVHAGGSVHHAILIWPLPQMVIAISFAAASRRLGRAAVPVLAAALAVMMVAGLLVTNEYFALLVRNGGTQN